MFSGGARGRPAQWSASTGRSDPRGSTDLEPTTISMSLIPRDYHPEEFPEPEMPPSNLYFSVDLERGVAAVALLAFDRDHESHQWLPRVTHGGRTSPVLPWTTPSRMTPLSRVTPTSRWISCGRSYRLGRGVRNCRRPESNGAERPIARFGGIGCADGYLIEHPNGTCSVDAGSALSRSDSGQDRVFDVVVVDDDVGPGGWVDFGEVAA